MKNVAERRSTKEMPRHASQWLWGTIYCGIDPDCSARLGACLKGKLIPHPIIVDIVDMIVEPERRKIARSSWSSHS